MNLFQAVLLGLVQGLTEFLPISSNAHLRITSALLGWQDPGAAFSAVTQIGTELAVLIYFRRDIGAIIRGFLGGIASSEGRSSPQWRLALFIITGSLPIAILGLLFKDPIENQFRSLYLIAGALIIFAIIFWVIDRHSSGRRTVGELTLGDSISFGLAQSLALIPGVSRSGGTIAAGLAMGYSRVEAARYSFLLAIPAVLGSGSFELKKIAEPGNSPQWLPTVVATGIAFVVGYAVIGWFLKYLTTHTFRNFMIYRIALGSGVAIALATGIISP